MESPRLEDSPRQRMASRQNLAETFCQKRFADAGSKHSDEQYVLTNCPLVSVRHRSQFCSIAKVASTFWTRFYKVLETSSSSVLDSPFSVPLKVADAKRCQSAELLRSLEESSGRVVKATFVREPFSRLFSAYIDKLLAPNPTFWIKWGVPALLLENGLRSKDVACGHRVTFKQFVRLVNERLHREDNHVMPSVRMCDLCKQNFDVIGKIETFGADLKYLTALLNVTFDPHLSLSSESKADAILDSVESPFEWRESITKCISSQEMGRRIWRKLQIRGIISSFRNYPFGDEDLSGMSSAEFTKAAMTATITSADKEQLLHQKKQAFMEAYRTVPLSDIQRFSELFRGDFEAFGYEPRPSGVFDRDANLVDTHSLDFNTSWTVKR